MPGLDWNDLRHLLAVGRAGSPATAGDTLSRRIGHLAYAAYAPAGTPAGTEEGLPWIGHDRATADLPPLPRREVWLLMHPESRGLARIAAAAAWLERTVGAWDA